MEINKQKAFEIVANETCKDIETIKEDGRFFESAFDTFFDLYDDLSWPEAMNLLRQSVSIELGQEKEGSVAELLISNHENIFITDFGYVYFQSA